MGEDVVSEGILVEVPLVALRAGKGVFARVLLQMLLVSGLRRELPSAKNAGVALLSGDAIPFFLKIYDLRIL